MEWTGSEESGKGSLVENNKERGGVREERGIQQASK